jgi:hypothetical protein
MSGTKGALEQLRGSIETAQIQFGKGLAPTIQWAARELQQFVDSGDLEEWGRKAGEGFQAFIREAAPLAESLFELAHEAWPAIATAAGIATDALQLAADIVGPLVDVFNKLPDPLQNAAIALAAFKFAQMGKLGSIAQVVTTFGTATAVAGSKAEQGGAKAQRGAKGFSALGGSLKSMGAIGAGVGLLSIADQAGEASDSLGALATIAGATAIGFGLGGPWGAAGGAAVGGLMAISAAGDDAAASMENLKAQAANVGGSLNQVTGAFTTTSRAAAANALANQGAFGAADRLGISYQLMLDAAMGNAGAQKKLNAELERNANAMARQGKWDEHRVADMELLKDSILATATSFADARAKIIAMTAAMTGIPKSVITQFEAPGADGAVKKAINLGRQYNLTPKQVTTILKALDYSTPQIRRVLKELFGLDGTEANPMIRVISNAKEVTGAVKRYLKGIKDEEVIIRIIRHHEDRRAGRIGHPGPMKPAIGSVIDYFDKGGIRENHVAQIASAGAMRVWAEPETGGEAYIPLALAKRKRALEVYAETGRRLGVESYANGGTRGGTLTATALIDYRRLADAIISGFSGSSLQISADNRSLAVKKKRG